MLYKLIMCTAYFNVYLINRPTILQPPCVSGIAKPALDGVLALGQGASGLRGPLASWRRAALDSIFAKGDSLRLQFIKEDIGTVYHARGGAAVVAAPESSPTAASVNSSEPSIPVGDRDGRDVYVPSMCPGARLPHVPVVVMHVASQWASSLARAHARCSLLDLVPYASPPSWAHAPPCPPCTLIASASAVEPGLDALVNDVHVVIVVATRDAGARAQWPETVSVVVDVHGAWPRLLQSAQERGAVLVRPDGHVGWRGEGAVTTAGVQDALHMLMQHPD